MKIIIFPFLVSFFLLFNVEKISAQKMFVSTSEIGVEKYTPNATLKAKVEELSMKYRGDKDFVKDENFYQLKNGNISFFQDSEYGHFRLIFDKNQNLLETHVLYHCDVLPEHTYFKIIAKIKPQIKAKKYTLENCTHYIKIITQEGFWYEIKASKKNNTAKFVFDKDIKLVSVNTK